MGKVKGTAKSLEGIQGILLTQAVPRPRETQNPERQKCLIETQEEATKKSRDLSKSMWVRKSRSSGRREVHQRTGASTERKGKVVGKES